MYVEKNWLNYFYTGVIVNIIAEFISLFFFYRLIRSDSKQRFSNSVSCGVFHIISEMYLWIWYVTQLIKS